jgi:hypothetical protein
MIGDHYRLGWTIDTPITQDFTPGEVSKGSITPAPSLDILNEGEL